MKLFPFSGEPKKQPVLKVPYSDRDTVESLVRRLSAAFKEVPQQQPILIICIGTDRSTGDALGPLVGSKLQKQACTDFHIFGTLDEPVHAMNLRETLDKIERRFKNPYIVGVDACLGQVSSVGCIQVGDGPLKPGAGVSKELPPVGNIHITGIVNVGGFMEYFVLQNTRLSLVMNMADTISRSLHLSLLSANRLTASS
ncbi:spore protease YyaC [Paenibacillus thermoaerophilus]|uniref:Spore protease YyaC n=1 Tax=Paenibacillus thermoaerophilus TaxID=1215385 RepID=A0ABW2V567_9BACL|nr:spore protease YyaC [Paenibacillus thermoaerophilus]TMV06689.1 spore protease YyaC [Paenibacillus thermoaerophilus]